MTLRFSIRTLLAAFTVVAVCCAGLTYANYAWANFFYSTALAMVLLGIVMAVLRRGPKRPFWIGFAVFATGYFVAADREERYLVLPGQHNVSREPSLATTQFLYLAREWMASLNSPTTSQNPSQFNFAPQVLGGQRASGGVYGGWQATPIPDRPGNFVLVGNAIFTLVFGIVGGVLGGFVASRGVPAPTNGREDLDD